MSAYLSHYCEAVDGINETQIKYLYTAATTLHAEWKEEALKKLFPSVGELIKAQRYFRIKKGIE